MIARLLRAQGRIVRRFSVDDWVAVIGALALFILLGLGAIFGGSPAP